MLPSVDPGEDKNILTVSEITRQIKHLLEGEFAVCWVVGEISNLKEPSSGHLYFSLKDSDAQIRAVCFRGSRLALRFKPVDGLEVLCFGRITVYEPRGEYQMIVEYMEPRGVGALKLLFEQIRAKLSAEGLFDPARKKPMPLCPQKVLVITSATGAAIRDILAVLRRAPFPTEVTIIPVQVQGDKAPKDIVDAIRLANELQSQNRWDVAIIGRGGGSIEDLWAFNEEEVVRAVAGLNIPSISAVGMVKRIFYKSVDTGIYPSAEVAGKSPHNYSDNCRNSDSHNTYRKGNSSAVYHPAQYISSPIVRSKPVFTTWRRKNLQKVVLCR